MNGDRNSYKGATNPKDNGQSTSRQGSPGSEARIQYLRQHGIVGNPLVPPTPDSNQSQGDPLQIQRSRIFRTQILFSHDPRHSDLIHRESPTTFEGYGLQDAGGSEKLTIDEQNRQNTSEIDISANKEKMTRENQFRLRFSKRDPEEFAKQKFKLSITNTKENKYKELGEKHKIAVDAWDELSQEERDKLIKKAKLSLQNVHDKALGADSGSKQNDSDDSQFNQDDWDKLISEIRKRSEASKRNNRSRGHKLSDKSADNLIALYENMNTEGKEKLIKERKARKEKTRIKCQLRYIKRNPEDIAKQTLKLNIRNSKVNRYKNKEEMQELIKDAWNELSQEERDKLIEKAKWSLQRVMDKVRGSGLDPEDDPDSHKSAELDQNRNSVESPEPSYPPQQTHYQVRDSNRLRNDTVSKGATPSRSSDRSHYDGQDSAPVFSLGHVARRSEVDVQNPPQQSDRDHQRPVNVSDRRVLDRQLRSAVLGIRILDHTVLEFEQQKVPGAETQMRRAASEANEGHFADLNVIASDINNARSRYTHMNDIGIHMFLGEVIRFVNATIDGLRNPNSRSTESWGQAAMNLLLDIRLARQNPNGQFLTQFGRVHGALLYQIFQVDHALSKNIEDWLG